MTDFTGTTDFVPRLTHRRNPPNEYLHPGGLRLGRLPRRSKLSALLLSHFLKPTGTPPILSTFWNGRAGFPLLTYGNTTVGDCTIASQAQAALRFERIEQRRTTTIAEEEPVRVYTALSDRLYGGGDNGAYEGDALDNWRDPALTFKDYRGRALTIDAYLRINVSDQDELRWALATAGEHGIKACLNLPWAFASITPPAVWDIPEGQALTGDWLPGSWGGHSMFWRDYNEVGPWVVHTWGLPDQQISWAAVAAYCDEAHLVVDSFDYWRTKKPEAVKGLNLHAVKRAVNKVSRVLIA